MADKHPLIIHSDRHRGGTKNSTGGTKLEDASGQSIEFHVLFQMPPQWLKGVVTSTCKDKDGVLSTIQTDDLSTFNGPYQTSNLALGKILSEAHLTNEKGKPVSLSDIAKRFETGTFLHPLPTPPDIVTVGAVVKLASGQEVGVLDAVCANPAIIDARAKGTAIQK